MSKIPTLLAIDPGIYIGFATFDNKGNLNSMGQVHLNDFTDWLEAQNPQPELLVVEDYRLFKHKALQQSGSKLETVKCIGIIESYCTRNKIPITMQAASILPIAEKLANIKRPTNHAIGHQICAVLHGEFYLIKNKHKKVVM